MKQEIDDIATRYQRRNMLPADRYSRLNPTVNLSVQERQRALISLFSQMGLKKLAEVAVLEVGCGAGGILATFKEQGHCVVGIDLGSEYVQYGSQTHGLDLRVAYLKDLSIDFVPDLIIYSHVMEHILDPLVEMAEIQRRCGENTLVYIEVPGLKNIHKAYQMDVMKYYQNAHSVHFTLGSLSVMMSKCDFALSAGDEYVHAIYKLGNEVSSAKNEYDTTRQYLITTENKRWQYPFTTVAIKQFLKRLLKPVLG